MLEFDDRGHSGGHPGHPGQCPALSYAENDIPVFPLKPRGKTPLTEHGFKDATTNEKIIRSWWRKWPHANIGIPTGEASGIDVLDVDPRHGGDASLQLLEQQYGPLKTRTAATGGGGKHLCFAVHPAAYRIITAAGVPGYPGLDVRTDGGYIAASPSVHESGNSYTWLTDPQEPLAQMPDWLLELLAKPERPPSSERLGKSNLISDAQDTGRYWLERFLADAYEGNRNAKGFGLACQLRDEGLCESEASDYMMAYAAGVPGDGYTEREALASLRSAYSAPPRERARSPLLQSVPSPRPTEIKFDFPAEGHEACQQRIAELEAEVERLKAVIARMNRHEKERQDIAAAKMQPATKLVVMDAVNHLDRDTGELMDYPIQGAATRRLHMAAGTVRKHLDLAAKAGVFETTVRPTGRDREECTAIRPGPLLLEQRRLNEVETAPSQAGGKREGAGRKPGKPGECGECGSHNVQTNTITTRTFKVTMEYTSVDQTCRNCGTREVVDGGTREVNREVISETISSPPESTDTEIKFDFPSTASVPSNLICMSPSTGTVDPRDPHNSYGKRVKRYQDAGLNYLEACRQVIAENHAWWAEHPDAAAEEAG